MSFFGQLDMKILKTNVTLELGYNFLITDKEDDPNGFFIEKDKCKKKVQLLAWINRSDFFSFEL